MRDISIILVEFSWSQNHTSPEAIHTALVERNVLRWQLFTISFLCKDSVPKLFAALARVFPEFRLKLPIFQCERVLRDIGFLICLSDCENFTVGFDGA